ncbi:MAG: hypothetical protein ACHQQQ_03895 [Bacteroidota bacterium]
MTDHQQTNGRSVFRYKLDFYYQQTLMYLIFLMVYWGLRGTIRWERLPSLNADPVLYIIIFFVLLSSIVLALNMIRERKLIITGESLIFHQKYHERIILLADIEWMYIGRERLVQTAGRSQVIVFKIKDRRRLFRIRIGRYERDAELLEAMEQIAERVPKIDKPSLKSRMSQMAKQSLRKD